MVLQEDIDILISKIENKFEEYKLAELNLEKQDKIMLENPYQRDRVHASNFIAQSYGRHRCLAMKQMTRKDHIEAMREYWKKQQECYQGMLNAFKGANVV